MSSHMTAPTDEDTLLADTPLAAGRAALAATAALALAACGGGHVDTPAANGSVQISSLPGSGGTQPAAPAAADRPSAVDAARFLSQATFGARSTEEIDALRTMGYEQWLWAQFNAPTLQHTSYLDWQRQRSSNLKASDDMSYEAIWQQWLFGADQLRARTAFALSQILVVSNIAPDLRPYAMSSYMDTLNQFAFGNYRDLLGAVTRHPTMGYYLNLLGSEKENAAKTLHPNENYAREFLQLFTIGLAKLNLDGSVQKDAAGNPLPTYDEATVQGFARAFSGWSFAQAKSFHNADENLEANWTTPMAPYAEYHESGSKQLLDGQVLSGGSITSDLDAALDSAFRHPNVAPFVCRQLIQRLVTSNPSPAYLARVAGVFNDNGSGVRGDLRAVVRAILLDAEARDPTLGAAGRFGKQREPVIRFANLLRALGAGNPNQRNAIHELDSSEAGLGQSPLLAPSVFNFFSPNYRPAGAVAAAGLTAPEFQITTETTVVGALNFFTNVINSGGYGGGDGRLTLDYTPWQTVAATPSALVDTLELLFFNGQMTAGTRSRLTTLVAAIPASQSAKRVKQALILTMLSPDHVIQT
jgi:uncharacterized protein (DUF1800 family)